MDADENAHVKFDRARRELAVPQEDQNHITASKAALEEGASPYRRFPTKSDLNSFGMDAVGSGWLPAVPLISTTTRVLAIGSCFASYFALWLAEHGFNKSMPQSPYNALLRFGSDFVSPAAIAQQFRWAFGELDHKEVVWTDRSGQGFESSEKRQKLVRETLLATDVLILTLGLSEVWYDRVTGEPLWRELPADQFEPERHVFRIETVAQTVFWLETIERLRLIHMPKLKIVYVVSPVPLTATFRAVSAVTANSASKAIVRAALDEFLRSHMEELNRCLFYFPGYELVQNYFIDAFEPDHRHVAPTVFARMIAYFAKHYCIEGTIRRAGTSLQYIDGTGHLEQMMREGRIADTDPRNTELLARVGALEELVTALQKVCDERQIVIEGLDYAARERLDVINLLDAEIKRLTA